MQRTIAGIVGGVLIIAVICLVSCGGDTTPKSDVLADIRTSITNLTAQVVNVEERSNRKSEALMTENIRHGAELIGKVDEKLAPTEDKAEKAVRLADGLKADVANQEVAIQGLQVNMKNLATRLGMAETRVENLSSNAMNMANDFEDVKKRAHNAESLAKNAEAKATEAVTIATDTRTHQERLASALKDMELRFAKGPIVAPTAAAATLSLKNEAVARHLLAPESGIQTLTVTNDFLSPGKHVLNSRGYPERVGRGIGDGKSRDVMAVYTITFLTTTPISKSDLHTSLDEAVELFHFRKDRGPHYVEKLAEGKESSVLLNAKLRGEITPLLRDSLAERGLTNVLTTAVTLSVQQ